MFKKSLIPIIVLLSLSSCSFNRGLLKREDLFALPLGALENELDVFMRGGVMPEGKNRLFMKEGIFFVSNGPGSKVLQLTSYGDLLSLYYNAEKNPQPVALSLKSSERSNKKAIAFPFNTPGEVAVTENRFLFVEEEVDESRRIIKATDSVLKNIILRFNEGGEYSGYIGQEGREGTPFAYIETLQVSVNNTLLVMTRFNTQYRLYEFSEEGQLLGKFVLDTQTLPGQSEDLMANVEGVFPSVQSPGVLLLQVGYYQEAIEEDTGANLGVTKSSSEVYLYDGSSQSYSEGFALPPYIVDLKDSGPFESQKIQLPYIFLGVSREDNLFFLTSGTHKEHTLFIYSPLGELLDRRIIRVEDEEFYASHFQVTPGGLLYALLVDHQEAKVVWWRSDRLRGD